MCFRISRFKRWLLFVIQAGIMTIFLHFIHWEFLEGCMKPLMCLESPHFEHLYLLLCVWLRSNIWRGGLWFLCSLEYLLWLFDLDLWECCFHLALFGGRSVLWCLIRLTYATWGLLATALMCLAVDFEHSIFLASWLTLLAGNLSKSMFKLFDGFGNKLLIF